MPNAKPPTIDDVSVGDIVHFYSRDEWVLADQQRRRPEPSPAFVLRKHRGSDGQPSGVAALMVFAESGARVAQASFSPIPAPDAWSPKPLTVLEITIQELIDAETAADRELIAEPPAPAAKKRPPPKKKKRVVGKKKR